MDTTKDELQKQIDEGRALLSKESREAIDNVNWKLTIWEMNKKYSQEQLENLETETELLLAGVLDTQEYLAELEKRMKLTKAEVSTLLVELDKLIFRKIKEDLEKRISKNVIPTAPETAKSVASTQVTEAEKPTLSFNAFKKITTPTESTTPIQTKNIPREPIQNPTPKITLDPRFIDMPEKVQEAISKSGVEEKVYDLAKRYQLSVEQSSILEDTTVKVMQNVIHPDHYESELFTKTETISKENVSSLVGEVNENILKVIRILMQGGSIPNTKQPQVNTNEIPLPPYKKVIDTGQSEVKNTSLEIKNEEIASYKPQDATIQNMRFPTKAVPQSEPLKPAKPNFEISDIKHNIIEEKLKGVTVSDHTVSDYSTPKISNPSASIAQNNSVQPPKGADPYREAF